MKKIDGPVFRRVLHVFFLISIAVLLALLFSYVIRPLAAPAPTPSPPPAPTPTPGPLGGLVIVVDAGHGGFDGGATGINGTVEAGINLKIALLLREELTALGATVAMTRESEEALAPTKREDMRRRGQIMNEGADAVVSVHLNKFSDSSVSGPMAFYMNGSAAGEALAQCVIDSVCDAVGRDRRAANPGDYFVIRECAAPSVLVECGFLSNPGDEALLNDPAHQQKLARGIAAGFTAWARLPLEWEN